MQVQQITTHDPVAKRVPRVSIGMPVYNGAKYIREALDSLLAQTFIDFELIISDNASTDSTDAICLEYAAKDARIQYVRQDVNCGAIENFRHVLNGARGQYFMWAACDDMWSENWLEVLLAGKTNSEVAVFGAVERKFESGGGAEPARRLRNFSKGSYIDFIFQKGGKSFYIYGLFDRELLTSQISVLTSINCRGMDDLFLQHLLGYGGLKSIGGAVLYARIHSEQASFQKKGLTSAIERYFGTFLLKKYYHSVRLVPCRKKLQVLFLLPFDYAYRQSRLIASILLGRR